MKLTAHQLKKRWVLMCLVYVACCACRPFVAFVGEPRDRDGTVTGGFHLIQKPNFTKTNCNLSGWCDTPPLKGDRSRTILRRFRHASENTQRESTRGWSSRIARWSSRIAHSRQMPIKGWAPHNPWTKKVVAPNRHNQNCTLPSVT